MLNKNLKFKYEHIVFAFFVASISFLLTFYVCKNEVFGGSDYYWHLALGRNLVSDLDFYSPDTLSWIANEAGTTYINYSWLSDIILYKLSVLWEDEYTAAGYFVCVSNAVILYILFLCWGKNVCHAALEYSKRSVMAWGCILISIWLSYNTITGPRPNRFALVFFTFSLYFIINFKTSSQFILPVLAALWANMHGASLPILLGIQFVYIIFAAVPKFQTNKVCNDVSFLKRRIFTFFVSFFAGLLNPYGISVYKNIFDISKKASNMTIAELEPATYSNCYVFEILAILVICSYFLKNVQISYIIPVIACSGMAILHIRFAPWAYVSTIIFIFSSLCFQCKKTKKTSKTQIILSGIFVLLVIITWNLFASNTKFQNSKMYPQAQLISTIQTYSPQRMYAGYNIGGYFEYFGIKASMDSRVELYSKEDINRYLALRGNYKIFTAETNLIESVLSYYNYDSAVLYKPDDSALSSYLSNNKNWQMIYNDENYVFFIRLS